MYFTVTKTTHHCYYRSHSIVSWNLHLPEFPLSHKAKVLESIHKSPTFSAAVVRRTFLLGFHCPHHRVLFFYGICSFVILHNTGMTASDWRYLAISPLHKYTYS